MVTGGDVVVTEGIVVAGGVVADGGSVEGESVVEGACETEGVGVADGRGATVTETEESVTAEVLLTTTNKAMEVAKIKVISTSRIMISVMLDCFMVYTPFCVGNGEGTD